MIKGLSKIPGFLGRRKEQERRALSAEAFTLIELIMVMTIIGILSVIVINRFDTYYEMKLSLAADNLVSDIRYAKNLADSYHTDVGIEFDTQDNYYRVYNINTGDNYISPATHDEFIVDFDTHPQFNAVSINSVSFDGGNTLIYNSLGRPENGAATALVNQGTVELSFHGHTETIEVHPGSGFCRKQ